MNDESRVHSSTCQPGDRINIINETPKAYRVKVVTACGTETLVSLHPGARLELTAGTSPADIHFLDVDEGNAGLRLVR
jgi:hypothetical protein